MPQAIYFGLYAPRRAHTHTHNPQSWSVVSQVQLGKMSFYPSVSEANVAVIEFPEKDGKKQKLVSRAGFLFRLEESEYIWLTTHKNKQL